jgi:predicted TPR repeat methyltransferase
MGSSFYNAGVIDALVECAQVGPASRVVDLGVGTGTGFVAAGLAPVPAAESVVGADSSAAMLTLDGSGSVAVDGRGQRGATVTSVR